MKVKIPEEGSFFKEDTPYVDNYSPDYSEEEYELYWFHETYVSEKELEFFQKNWELASVTKTRENEFKITI